MASKTGPIRRVKRIRIAAHAARDIDHLIADSRERFGPAAAERYRRLIGVALRNLAADPARSGVIQRGDIQQGLSFYHLRHSRRRDFRARVGRPRHFLVFRLLEDALEVIRVLHDAMNLESHLEG